MGRSGPTNSAQTLNLSYNAQNPGFGDAMIRKPRRPKSADQVIDFSAPMRVTKSPSGHSRRKKSQLDRLFGGLAGIALRLSRDEYVSGEDLATAIEARPGEPLPDIVRDYVCRYLRGKVKQKPGPQKSRTRTFVTETAVALEYERELRRLQAERRARGGRTAKGEPAPHEEAAIIIQKRYKSFAMMTPRRVANILSSRKYR